MPSNARLILFHTSLHYIDIVADLRSRSEGEFLLLYNVAFPLKLCVTVRFQ